MQYNCFENNLFNYNGKIFGNFLKMIYFPQSFDTRFHQRFWKLLKKLLKYKRELPRKNFQKTTFNFNDLFLYSIYAVYIQIIIKK